MQTAKMLLACRGAILTVFSLTIVISSIGQPSVATAQANTTSMHSAMTEMAKIHLKAADTALTMNDTATALDRIALAQLQLSMMGMKSAGMFNASEPIGYVMGKDPCLLNNDGIIQCRYPR